MKPALIDTNILSFFFRFFVIVLADFELVCLMTEENCLLKALAILLELDIYLPLNLIDSFELAFGPPFKCFMSLKSWAGLVFLLTFSLLATYLFCGR